MTKFDHPSGNGKSQILRWESSLNQQQPGTIKAVQTLGSRRTHNNDKCPPQLPQTPAYDNEWRNLWRTRLSLKWLFFFSSAFYLCSTMFTNHINRVSMCVCKYVCSIAVCSQVCSTHTHTHQLWKGNMFSKRFCSVHCWLKRLPPRVCVCAVFSGSSSKTTALNTKMVDTTGAYLQT